MAVSERERLTVDLSHEQKAELTKLLPWGTGRMMVSSTIVVLINFIKANGLGMAMDAFIKGNVKMIITTSSNSNGHSTRS